MSSRELIFTKAITTGGGGSIYNHVQLRTAHLQVLKARLIRQTHAALPHALGQTQ